MQDYDKYGRVRTILEAEGDGRKVLIFCETKRGCDDVSARRYVMACMHAQMPAHAWPAGRVLLLALQLSGLCHESSFIASCVFACGTKLLLPWQVKQSHAESVYP